MTLDAPPPPVSTMRRDIVSAYLASGMKVASWAVVMGMVYRIIHVGAVDLISIFVLARGTLGLLNYTTLGLAPAIIHLLAKAKHHTPRRVIPASEPDAVLSYRRDEQFDITLPEKIRDNAVMLSLLIGVFGFVAVIFYAAFFPQIHHLSGPVPGTTDQVVSMLGFGIVMRLVSDSCGAVLQTEGYIFVDNLLLAAADLFWVVAALLVSDHFVLMTDTAATLFTWSSALLLVLRGMVTHKLVGLRVRTSCLDFAVIGSLLSFGLFATFAQLADFLYAPTDFLLINHLLRLDLIAVYAPAVQIDSGLLLVVTAIAMVLLPKSAVAHASGDRRRLRQYYVRGTAASTGLLIIAAGVVYFICPWIFKVWLDDPMPATQTILPLILIHTVVGGSSAVGRSILLGMGKVKPFTVAVLVAGVSNVVLSCVFVQFFGLGLRGIVLGTICAVVGRCAIWQPWYVWKCLKQNATTPQ
ncbi:hypothetical protein BH10PLA1_BH10PLA1_16070 [soil metagenome]